MVERQGVLKSYFKSEVKMLLKNYEIFNSDI